MTTRIAEPLAAAERTLDGIEHRLKPILQRAEGKGTHIVPAAADRSRLAVELVTERLGLVGRDVEQFRQCGVGTAMDPLLAAARPFLARDEAAQLGEDLAAVRRLLISAGERIARTELRLRRSLRAEASR